MKLSKPSLIARGLIIGWGRRDGMGVGSPHTHTHTHTHTDRPRPSMLSCMLGRPVAYVAIKAIFERTPHRVVRQPSSKLSYIPSKPQSKSPWSWTSYIIICTNSFLYGQACSRKMFHACTLRGQKGAAPFLCSTRT